MVEYCRQHTCVFLFFVDPHTVVAGPDLFFILALNLNSFAFACFFWKGGAVAGPTEQLQGHHLGDNPTIINVSLCSGNTIDTRVRLFTPRLDFV